MTKEAEMREAGAVDPVGRLHLEAERIREARGISGARAALESGLSRLRGGGVENGVHRVPHVGLVNLGVWRRRNGIERRVR